MYDWYKIFNHDEFLALDLVSKAYTLNLEDIGRKTILVTRGNYTSIIYDGVILSLNMNDKNPFTFESKAIYIDANKDVFLGVAVAN